MWATATVRWPSLPRPAGVLPRGGYPGFGGTPRRAEQRYLPPCRDNTDARPENCERHDVQAPFDDGIVAQRLEEGCCQVHCVQNPGSLERSRGEETVLIPKRVAETSAVSWQQFSKRAVFRWRWYPETAVENPLSRP